MTEPDMSNANLRPATKQRWCDLAFMAAAGAAILVAFAPIYIQPFEWLVNQPSWLISAIDQVRRGISDAELFSGWHDVAQTTVVGLYSAYRGDLPNDEVVRRVVRAAQARTTSELVQ